MSAGIDHFHCSHELGLIILLKEIVYPEQAKGSPLLCRKCIQNGCYSPLDPYGSLANTINDDVAYGAKIHGGKGDGNEF